MNRPFNYHVASAIYRIWKKLKPAPLFGEGAAKSHFGWWALFPSQEADRGVDELIRRYLTAKIPDLILPCADFDVKPKR